jgi:hypothetical protein
MFNFIEIYSFIPVSGYVDRGPSALLWPGAYCAVKMALPTGVRYPQVPKYLQHVLSLKW